MRIAFIGGGHMATSLIGGLVRRGTDPATLGVSDPVPGQLQRLARDFGVRGTADNNEAVRDADLVVLAVKPQEMANVARGLSRELAARRRIVVSIAAGLRLGDLGRWLGDGIPVVRAMPNRPALVGSGITALYAGSDATDADRAAADDLMAAVGETVWLEDESQMDVVTAVSGSGPAYFFLLIEALEAAGIEHGLSPPTARRLAIATAQGAGRLASESGEAPATLREQVTSKGGTTAAALEVLEASAVRTIFRHAVSAATRRSAELAGEFGGH